MKDLRSILEDYRRGALDLDDALRAVNGAFFEETGETTLDHDRTRRTGAAEVIYGEYKTPRQVADAFAAIAGRGDNVLATRIDTAAFAAIEKATPGAEYHGEARLAMFKTRPGVPAETAIAVVTAGTSDLPVAEEAALTCEFYDHPVLRIRDVGIAGVHRLLARADDIRSARVVIVVAGMEGALPSAVGGLVDKPVIAVPTSVGYGASFGGIAALLGMLNSCATGVAVVNIDNGFGAGYLASRINGL